MSDAELVPSESEITVINDGDGIALIGAPAIIESFLSANGIESRAMGLPRGSQVTSAASGLLGTATTVAGNSGRWVKLTKDSAKLLHQGIAMKGTDAGVSRAILVTKSGTTSHILQFSKNSVMSVANPGLIAGAPAIMNQLAMQQAMKEINDYLQVIDAKVDAIMRAQKDAVFADMIGVEMAIEEALVIRESVGHVSEVTWSKVQSSGVAITRTQAYALRQIAAQADALDKARSVGDIATDVKKAAGEVNDWLAVIARCVQLHDAVGILELDRVLTSAPDEIESHRVAVKAARAKRLDLISTSTLRLLTRVEAAANTANAKVLLHPTSASAVISSSARIEHALVEFHTALGVGGDRDAISARKWRDAATDLRDKAIESGTAGVEGAKRLGGTSVDRAKQTATGLSAKVPGLKGRGADKPDASE